MTAVPSDCPACAAFGVCPSHADKTVTDPRICQVLDRGSGQTVPCGMYMPCPKHAAVPLDFTPQELKEGYAGLEDDMEMIIETARVSRIVIKNLLRINLQGVDTDANRRRVLVHAGATEEVIAWVME